MPKSGGKNNPAPLIDQLLNDCSYRWLIEGFEKKFKPKLLTEGN